MSRDLPIIGAKGGGKGAGGGGTRSPVEAADTLRSRQFARIIDLVCEGEIEGLATGDEQSIYYDKTPLKNPDGTFNFSGATIATRPGTQSQSYIPGFPDVESEHPVNVQVTYGSPVVRTITSDVYSQARVTVSIPQMTDVNTSNGDTNGSSVDISIDLQPNGGSYTTVVTDTIAGKTTTKYERSYLIQLTGPPPWNIRVNRLTEDSGRATLQNQTWFESYTEIVEAKLRYPNSAIVSTVIDSQQFSQIPQRGYDLKLLRIQVPSNYDPDTRTYTGTWDGTFQIAWSDNPAWCFYDLITNDRYGLGEFVNVDQIDKWSLYAIGKYCDELVDDGFGGKEPRFTCNLYLQTQAEAFKVVQDMASIFRGLVYWSTGLITPIQDSPSDPVALYTNANIEGGKFSYQGSSQKARHTVALVTWNDPDDFYAQKKEYVEGDAASIARYGYVPTSVVAMGCTSRGQAHRAGKWLLYSEANETETVTFRSGLDGTVVRPGQIMNIQDRDRAGARLGGRVAAATTTQVTVDQGFTKTPGVTYTLYVFLPNGSVGTSIVTDVTGNVVTLSSALADVPATNAIWMVSSDLVALQQFRVITAVDVAGKIEITGLKYNPSKYVQVEQGVILTETPVSLLTVVPDTPTAITIDESLYNTAGGVKVLVTVAWNQVTNADSYTVSYIRDDGNPITVTGIKSQLLEIRDAAPGFYKVTVYAVSTTLRQSTGAYGEKQIYGKTSPPSDVQQFTLVGISNGVAQLQWQQSDDLDVVIGGYVRIRYSPDVVTPSWSDAVDIGPALPGAASSASLPLVNGTYLAKFIDSSGNDSVNPSTIVTTAAAVASLNVVGTVDESAFPGTKTNTVYNADLGGLVLDAGMLIDDAGMMDDLGYLDSLGGIAAAGEYDFANVFDLGAVYQSNLTAAIAVEGYDAEDLIDSRTDTIDSWLTLDGDTIDDVNAVLYVSTTEDDPAASPTWSTWRPFFIGQYIARAFRFKLALTSELVTHNIAVKSLVVTIDMPDRVESDYNLVSGAAPYPVTFPAAFKATPTIGITAQDMQTGDYFQITAQSESGFTIAFFDSTGSNISRTFNYLADGYGYSQ